MPTEQVADAEGALHQMKEVYIVKLQAFRIAVTVSTLMMLVAASGAGKKWCN